MNKRSAEETKRNILTATRKVFAEQGYEQASMRAIAVSAGVSIGGVYLYFKSKEELYLTLMAEWMDELDRLTTERLDRCRQPREAVAAFIEATIEVARSRKDMILLQGKEIGCSFGWEMKRKFFTERRARLAGLIEEGVAQGIFRPCDAEEAAKFIFNALRGYVLSMVIEEEALFTPDTCVEMVLNGLTRRNG